MPRTAYEALTAFDQLNHQIAETAALGERLERDLADATATLQLADEKAIAAIQTKQTQLALLPRKLAQLEALRGELEAGLREAVEQLRREITDVHSAIRATLLGRVTGALLPFCEDRTEAERLAESTTAIRRVAALAAWDSFSYAPADRLRRALAALDEANKALKAAKQA